MARPMSKAEWIAAMKLWEVPVKYYAGWDTRGRPGDFDTINGVMIHHTGSDAGQSDAYLKFLFVTGRPEDGIPGPLCHSAADMDGDLWMGAIGRANHAGRGSGSVLNAVASEDYRGFSAELAPGLDNTDGNAHFYGCEVRYDGGQPMTPKQYAAAVRWATAICHHYGWSALSVIGHREWTRRKSDPGNCPMTKFRADVAALLKAGPNPVEDEMTPAQMQELKDFITAKVEAAKTEIIEYTRVATVSIKDYIRQTDNEQAILDAVAALPAATAREIMGTQIVDMDQPKPEPTPENPNPERPTIAFSSHVAHGPWRTAKVIKEAS